MKPWNLIPFLLLAVSCQQVDQSVSSANYCTGAESGTDCEYLTSPTLPAGLTLDRQGTNSLANLPTLSWSLDAQSTNDRYEVALGSVPGASDVLNWTSVGMVNSYKFRSMALTECRQYYPSLRLVNKAGHHSTVAMEAGFTLDKTAPVLLSTVSAKQFDGHYDRTVTASWDTTRISDNCERFSYQLAVGTTAGATNILNWKTFKAVSKKQIHSDELDYPMPLQRGMDYYTSLRVIDAGGNVSSPATSGAWHFYDPLEIGSITFWGDFSDFKTVYKDANCSSHVEANGDPIACVHDRAGSINTLSNSAFPLPTVSSSLSNGNSRMTIADSFLTSSPLSMNSMMMIHKHPPTNVDWNYLMDWRNSVGSSWWSAHYVAGAVGGFWTGLHLNGNPAPIGGRILFDNNVNIAYMTGSTLSFNASLTLGSRFTHDELSHGEFGEIFIFNNVLTNFERQKLEGYLACKWGNQINLPASHPYKSACPR